MIRQQELVRAYDEYVATYRDDGGRLPEMMQLKRQHTDAVVGNATLVADGEGFDARQREVAVAAALLHDTGRYEQLRVYNTFKDSDSVDHAVFSHDIVRAKGWLEAFVDEPAERAAILAAVLYHNRRELPEGLDALTLAAARAVRDADKLDIFRVLEDRVRHTDWKRDTRAFWNLALYDAPNPEVVAAIEARRPVDYQNIRSLADFVLIQVGWMISGLYYPVSRRLASERGHLAFRRDFLRRLTDDPVIDRICDLAGRLA